MLVLEEDIIYFCCQALLDEYKQHQMKLATHKNEKINDASKTVKSAS